MTDEKEERVLKRDIFDAKVNLIIAQAKYKANKKEIENLKQKFRLLTCEIQRIVSNELNKRN